MQTTIKGSNIKYHRSRLSELADTEHSVKYNVNIYIPYNARPHKHTQGRELQQIYYSNENIQFWDIKSETLYKGVWLAKLSLDNNERWYAI